MLVPTPQLLYCVQNKTCISSEQKPWGLCCIKCLNSPLLSIYNYWMFLAKRFTGLYHLTGVEWGLHFPAANGEYQSPINLNSREALYDPSLLDVRLSPNYVVCRDCEVINDGHTVRIILRSKSGDYKGTRLLVVSFVRTSTETCTCCKITVSPLLPDVFPMTPWCSCTAVSC